MAAIENRIVIGNDQENPIFDFNNDSIYSVNSDTSVSLVGEELYIDQFDTTVDYYVWQPYVINPADSPTQELGPFSGDVVTFNAPDAGAVSAGEISIEPVQSGSGAPSPTNIRPIRGFSSAHVYVSPTQDAQDATVYIIDLDGTRYGGTLDLETGVLTVTKRYFVADGVNIKTTGGYGASGPKWLPCIVLSSADYAVWNTMNTSYLKTKPDSSFNIQNDENTADFGNSAHVIVLHIGTMQGTDGTHGYNSANEVHAAVNAYLQSNPLEVCYTLATPFTVQLTAHQIQTRAGVNTIWSDTGSITGLKALVGGEYDAFVSSDGYILCSRQNYDIRLLPYGTKIVYYAAGSIVGTFYVQRVERLNKAQYKISAVSAVGIMDSQYHKGGVYQGTTIQELIEEILGNDFNYSIDGVVAAQTVYGWLPYDTKRKNLYQLLLAFGIEITLGDNGAMFFSFPETGVPRQIPADRVFQGGKMIYDEPASSVEVNEHSYHYDPGIAEVVLFDNTSSPAADETMVIFDQPIYPSSIYCADGNLVISSQNANYAVVSGNGILKGKPYVHNVRLISQSNPNTQVEKVVSVQDATLISFVNADNVLARLAEYYFNANRVEQDIIVDGEKPGILYTTENAYGELVTGYITKMSKSVTSFARAHCRFLLNYTPVGSGSGYTNRILIPLGENDSYTWEIPQYVFDKETPSFRVTLIGKGQDGENGENGENGAKTTSSRPGKGGAGGQGGSGGQGGNILTVTLLADGLTEITVANDGEESILTSALYNYSSANGSRNIYGFFDPLTGQIFARAGKNGVAGASGGQGGYYTHTQKTDSATDGESLTHLGVTYWGGTRADESKVNGAFLGGTYSSNLTLYTGSAGGGGAAVGNDGGDAFPADSSPSNDWWNWGSGGKGGDGLDADPTVDMPGTGGNGGHGGGGGGSSGNWESWNHEYSSVIGVGAKPVGVGGSGGRGGEGKYGCAIIYY